VLAVATSSPLTAPYVIQLVLCALALASLALVPETRPPRPREEVPVPRLTPAARHAFVAAALTSGIVWWLASLFISILPAFAATLLGVRSPALQGALALVVFVVSPLAQIVGRGVSDRFAARAGLIGTAVALAALLGAVPARSLALFALAGSSRAPRTGSVLGRAEHRQPHRAAAARARLSARFYAITYVCIGVTVLAVGALTTWIGLYAALTAVATGVVVAALALAVVLPAAGRSEA